MKKYISANIAIVRMHSNIIATSLSVDGEDYSEGDHSDEIGAPERRYRNGRYNDRYDQNYGL